MKVEDIASIVHDANRAYCCSIGDDSQYPWTLAPRWQQDSAVAGVRAIIANPAQSPEQSHDNWLTHKIADGWVYGKEKDVQAKTHPCMVPYKDLPKSQQVKDKLFTAIVRVLI